MIGIKKDIDIKTLHHDLYNDTAELLLETNNKKYTMDSITTKLKDVTNDINNIYSKHDIITDSQKYSIHNIDDLQRINMYECICADNETAVFAPCTIDKQNYNIYTVMENIFVLANNISLKEANKDYPNITNNVRILQNSGRIFAHLT